MFAVFACSRPIVGSKRVQSPRAVHIAMSRTIIIPVSDTDVLSTTLNDEYSTRVVGGHRSLSCHILIHKVSWTFH